MIKVIASPRARKYANEKGIELDFVNASGPNGRIIEEDIIHYINQSPDITKRDPEKTSKKITALAKKISNVENVDYQQIRGTGIDGKITSQDVISFINQPAKEKVAVEEKPLAGMRKIIAERMTESKRNAPHVTLTVKVEATELVKHKNSISQELKVTYTDLLVKIVSHSLKMFPKMNVSLNEDKLLYSDTINIGVAVALEDGLVVPHIKHVDKKTLQEVSSEIKDAASRAKEGRLTSADMESGSITISNLGMYEVDGFTPVINLPESSILGIGRIVEDVIVENEQIRIGKTMTLSLSFDHRVVDGAPAAAFLSEIKRLIENPEYIPGGVEQ